MIISTKNKKVSTLSAGKPSLRFPGFFGEWEEKKLGEVAKFWNGKAHEQDISEDGNYIVVNSKFISQNGKVKKYSNSQTSPLKKDDIAIVMSDIPNGKAIGKCFLVDDNKKYTLNQRIGGIKSDQILSKFLIKILNRNKYFLLFDNGVSQTNLRRDEILGCPIIFPAITEQQKIASFLGAVDEWVENLKAQKESLEKYKKGMMQKIFSQEVRFKDENGKNFAGLERRKLLDICSLITKGTTPTSVSFKFEKNGINFIKVENISKNFHIDINSTPKISKECNESLRRSALKENDILFTIAGTLGRTAIVKSKDLPANTNQAVSIIRLESNKSIKFINYFLNSIKIKKRIYQLLSIGAQPNLSLEQVGSFEISFPGILEQQKIAEFLTSIDNLIESKQQQITQAEQWKKGLMQGLFI